MKPRSNAPTKAPAHRFRRAGVVALATLGVTAMLTGCLSSDQQNAETLLNADRSANGMTALIDYSAADVKAQAWANHLASLDCTPGVDCLSHTTLSDGYQPGTWCYLGENVGMGGSLQGIETGFMNSPVHRGNILGSQYNHVGTGVARNATTGYTFVVQEFVDVC